MKQEAHDYFVGISDPIQVRKNILESSRMLIHSLQRYERYKLIRHRKHEAINRLAQINREIGILLTKLKNEMPKVPARKKTVQKPAKKEPEPRLMEPPRVIPEKPKVNEIDRLQSELNEIESQLKELQ